MGEFIAPATQLGRDVALKILPELFTSDADRVARLKREAQVEPSVPAKPRKTITARLI